MTTMQADRRIREPTPPKLGPLARKALEQTHLPPGEHKLLVLLAAYRDAGECQPAVFTMAHRLHTDAEEVDRLLRTLHRRRAIILVTPRPGSAYRNGYHLVCLGMKPPRPAERRKRRRRREAKAAAATNGGAR